MAEPKIQVSTRLQQLLEHAEGNARYDAWACRILGEPMVLARIASYYVPELEKLSLRDIVSNMIGTIDIGVQAILPDGTPAEHADLDTWLASSTAVDKSDAEGDVYFDVIVHIRLPESEKVAQVIVNVEAQIKDWSWQRLSGRIQYHDARMLSSEHNTIFVAPAYEKLCPVYSIWVIPSRDKVPGNKILRVGMGEPAGEILKRQKEAVNNIFAAVTKDISEGRECLDTARLGALREKVNDAIEACRTQEGSFWKTRHFRSLMNATILWLGEPNKTTAPGLKFLDTIFDKEIPPGQKGEILESTYGIPKTMILDKEVEKMGAFSSAIWENAEFRTSLSKARTLAAMLQAEGYAEDKIAEMVANLAPDLTKKQRRACINGTELTEEDFYEDEDEESSEDDVPTSNTMINLNTPVAEIMRGLLAQSLPDTTIVDLIARGYPAMETADIRKLLEALQND